MKKILTGLMLLGSLTTFASSDCDQKLDALATFSADHVGVSKQIIRKNNADIQVNNEYIGMLKSNISIEFIAGKDLELLAEENEQLKASNEWSNSVIEESMKTLELFKDAAKQACK
jgi:hypothetical protein